MSEFEFTDRYGGSYPDPSTVCRGQCEGIGRYPQHASDSAMTNEEHAKWMEEHARAHSYRFMFGSLLKHLEWWYWRSVLVDMLFGLPCDGYHFIECADCNGTGKRPSIEQEAQS